jgi:hypothetical protein
MRFGVIIVLDKRTPGFRHRDRIRHGADDGYGKDADPARRDGPRYLLFANGKIYATMTMMIDIREDHDRAGRSPFREWFDKLSSKASKKDRKEGE